jgi:hypothetical protein
LNDFIASLIPVYLHLIETGQLPSTPLEPNNVATVGNIFGTPVVE